MSIATPLTASSDIARSFSSTITIFEKEKALKPDLGVFSTDVVEISRLGIEKEQKETQVEATRKIENIASEVVRISSSIGRAQSIGNLTNSQAINLYNEIAALL